MYSFIETRLFTRLVQDYLGDDEYRRLQIALLENPEAGDIIPGSGGIRKVRWRAPGRGKRGGYRVIYSDILASTTVRIALFDVDFTLTTKELTTSIKGEKATTAHYKLFSEALGTIINQMQVSGYRPGAI